MNKIQNKELPLRPNVCMLVFNEEGKLFLGERKGEPNIWQFPQGGAEKGLSLEENVYKELSEELGASKKHFEIVKKLKATHEYNFKHPPAYAKNKWRGQSQTFWLVKFLGKDTELDLAKHNPEFMDFKWCSLAQVRKLADPIRVSGYENALKEAAKLIKKDYDPPKG
ncbi:MAG: NUDIX domain-containing protein [bacterium]|nr:NUDIX domain-containing protein [bacterium]